MKYINKKFNDWLQFCKYIAGSDLKYQDIVKFPCFWLGAGATRAPRNTLHRYPGKN